MPLPRIRVERLLMRFFIVDKILQISFATLLIEFTHLHLLRTSFHLRKESRKRNRITNKLHKNKEKPDKEINNSRKTGKMPCFI